MQKCIEDLISVTKQISLGGSEKARERHQSRNKLLVRDRIHLLLDKNSDFLETNMFAAYKVYDEEVNSAGIVTGIGKIKKYFIVN